MCCEFFNRSKVRDLGAAAACRCCQCGSAVNAALDRVQLSIPSVNAAFGRVHDGQVLPNVNCATWVQRHAAGHSIPNPLYQKNKDTFMVSLFFLERMMCCVFGLNAHLALWVHFLWEKFLLRGPLKTCPRHVFLTRTFDSQSALPKKTRTPLRCPCFFGADDGNRTHTISLEG